MTTSGLVPNLSLDDKLSDQVNVFRYKYLENLTTSMSTFLGPEDSHALPSTPEPVRRLINTLDLDIPADGCIIPNEYIIFLILTNT